MIRMMDGSIDNRVVIGVYRNGDYDGKSAIVLNEDGSYDTVVLSYEWSSGYLDPIISDTKAKHWIVDRTDEQFADYCKYLFNSKFLGQDGYRAVEGMELEVIKGRKVAKGTRFIANKIFKYVVPNTYGRVSTVYANGVTESGEKIHVDVYNTKIVGIGEYDFKDVWKTFYR